MHLKKDPFTSARTWYVRLGPGMRMPWEVHSMVEEGYVMQGRYTLAECLPARTVIGDYREGGYFWRPGGIPHSGPESGPDGAVMWLQRSPVALDVALYQQCAAGRASAPLLPP
jgi:quercetin dioxygenase-like cupin family protein